MREGEWTSYIFCRNCLLKQVTEGRIKETGSRGRTHKQLQMTIRKQEDTRN
jgi:hypothetical protein